MFEVFKQTNARRSVRDELIIDIYGNEEVQGLAILIDRDFERELLGLELDLNDDSLVFHFEGGEEKDLGAPLKEDLIPRFLEREEVKFCIMDMKSKMPVEQFMIPLSVTEEGNEDE